MRIKTEDGKSLEVKEGVVVDAEGNTLSHLKNQTFEGSQPRIRVFKAPSWAVPLFGILAPIVLVAGFGLFTTLCLILMAIWFLRSLLMPFFTLKRR